MNQMKTEILNGNEIVIQGALEAGFHLFTGYPGSPLADYFNILHEKKNEFAKKGIRVAIGNSEANAAAMVSGAKQANKNSLLAMKSMGLHVASDALSVGNFANPGSGGVVVVVGDDPWSISTSTPADSRYLFKHLHIPFLDPATPQELKDWIQIALDLSRETSVYQGLILTTVMAEGGGRVVVSEQKVLDQELIELDPATFDLSKNVMVPPNSLKADITMIKERFPKVLEALKNKNLDRTLGQADSKVGFISSGATFEVLKHVLDESEALNRFSLYKVAAPYPLIDEAIVNYLKNLETLIVVEEKRGFLETEVRELASRYGLNLKIYGKKFVNDKEGFPVYGGLNYDIVFSKLSELFSDLKLSACHSTVGKSKPLDALLPRRLPTFCPGCPHRETLSLLKDLRGHLKKQNINLITHGDVGCYSLSFLEPFKEMHNLSAMGQGGALGAGVDIFTTNPSVVLMGDSTFFHSGLTDISNSVQLGHDITYILLDNDNTAMTGHQMSPSTGESVEGKKRPAQDMLRLVQALGVSEALEVNPSDRYFYQNLLREMVLKKGTKVIISNKECGLTFHGKKKALERKLFKEDKVLDVARFYQINTDACEDCRVCVEMTGCPGLSQTHDAYGTKVMIDPQICVSDSYCTKLKACPSFEMVEVLNFHPSKYKMKKEKFDFNLDQIKAPTARISLDDIAKGRDYRIVVTGVGGSGVTTISRVLAEASKEMGGREDVDFKFIDQKGLAQRNGNVTSHLSFFAKGKSHAQVTPIGGGDLLLSPDLLDGANHLHFISQDKIAIFDSTFQIPLSILLDYGEKEAPLTEEKLREKIEAQFKNEAVIVDLKKVSEQFLGKSVYASAMILGSAFQKGLLPFSEKEMHEAFVRTVNKNEVNNNILAFKLGRMLIEEPHFYKSLKESVADENETIDLYRQSIKESSLVSGQKNLALFEKNFNELKQVIHGHLIRPDFLARYIHDQIIFDRGEKLASFIDEAKKLVSLYGDNLSNLEIALRTVAKTYIIKDEVYVAHLMISPMRRAEDKARYSDLGTSYQKVFINRPSFDLFDRKVEFDLSPKNWMLKMMRHARFIRPMLPKWHKKEREIALLVKTKILNHKLSYSELKAQENIKGYREVRYEKAL